MAYDRAVGTRAQLLLVTVVALVAARLIADPPNLATNSPFALVAWACVLVVCALLPIRFLPREARRGSELGVIYAGLWAFIFGLVSIQWTHQQTVVGEALTRGQITECIALMSVAILCFWVGYLWVRRRPTSPTELRAAYFDWTAMVGGYVVGLAAALYLIHSGLYGYSVNLVLPQTLASNTTFNALQLITLGMPLATYGAFIAALRSRSPGATILSLVFLFGLMLIGLAEGSKWYTFEPPAFFALIYAIERGRFPRRWIAGVILFLLLVVVPGNLLFRTQSAPSLSPSQTIGLSQVAAVAGTHLSLTQRVSTVAQWVRERFASIDTIALIVTQTPRPNPYEYGSWWVLAPAYNVIPRALWPGKPVLDAEYLFDRNYRHLPPGIITNTGLTEVGDLYMNFGFPGVLIGMIVLGLTFAYMARNWAAARDPVRLLVFLIFADQVLLTDHSVTDLLLILPRMMLVGYVGARVMVRRVKSVASTRDGSFSAVGPGGP